MKYAKLINNLPSYAPNPILHGGLWYGNPPSEIYTAEGYKPVSYTEQPVDPGEGYQWVESWSETAAEIAQDWVLVEKTVYDGDEAMDFIFGGEN